METIIKEDVFNDKLDDNAAVILPGQGTRIQAGPGSCTFVVTSEMSNGRLGIYRIVVPPKTVGARLHFHRFMDEVFMVNKGELTIELGTEIRRLKEGSTVYVPRFTPHEFSNESDETLEITLVFNPSEQREGYFKGLFQLLSEEQMDQALFMKLAQKYDTCML